MADENLVDSFWAVARRLRRLSREALAPWDVAPSQSRALGMLRRHGPLRLGELSERLRIVPRSATEVVDGLQERGWCIRQPDPTDRRATVVTLTESGRELSEAIRAAQLEEADKFFSVLADEERNDLAVTLGRLMHAEEDAVHAADPAVENRAQ